MLLSLIVELAAQGSLGRGMAACPGGGWRLTSGGPWGILPLLQQSRDWSSLPCLLTLRLTRLRLVRSHPTPPLIITAASLSLAHTHGVSSLRARPLRAAGACAAAVRGSARAAAPRRERFAARGMAVARRRRLHAARRPRGRAAAAAAAAATHAQSGAGASRCGLCFPARLSACLAGAPRAEHVERGGPHPGQHRLLGAHS